MVLYGMQTHKGIHDLDKEIQREVVAEENSTMLYGTVLYGMVLYRKVL